MHTTKDQTLFTTSVSIRSSLSFETFQSIAQKLAQEYGQPIAICKRSQEEGEPSSVTFRNKLLSSAEAEGSEIVEIVRPENGIEEVISESSEMRLIKAGQIIADTLPTIPGSDRVDEYFGVTSRSPQQPAEEGDKISDLLNELASGSNAQDYTTSLIDELTRRSAPSSIDAGVLRALRQTREERIPNERPSEENPDNPSQI